MRYCSPKSICFLLSSLFSTAWLSQQHIKIKLKSNAELGDRAAYGGFFLIAFFFSRPPGCSPHPLVTHRNKKCKEKQMQKVIRIGSILLGACSMEPPPCQHFISPTLTLWGKQKNPRCVNEEEESDGKVPDQDYTRRERLDHMLTRVHPMQVLLF